MVIRYLEHNYYPWDAGAEGERKLAEWAGVSGSVLCTIAGQQALIFEGRLYRMGERVADATNIMPRLKELGIAP